MPGLERRRPIAVDLFSGAGGMSLGVEQAGFDVVASLEYDPVHAATHEFNFPKTQVVCADISKVSVSEMRKAIRQGARAHGHSGADLLRAVDVVVGGPPCQGFSAIGKRLIDDTRNRLVFHFFRVVSELRPRYFVMENVPGMRTGEQAAILEQLVSEFERNGYSIARPIQILNAADYGVPQSRRRLFLLGWRNGERPLDYPDPLTDPSSISGESSESGLPPGPTVADALYDLPDHDHFPELMKTDEVRLDPFLTRRLEQQASEFARRLRGLDRDPGDKSHPRAWDPQMLTSSARTRHTPLSMRRFAGTSPGETEPVSRFLRLHPEGLCNTLRAGTGSERGAYTSPRPIHPVYPRVLSVREAARLHSFPDWFRLQSTKWHGFRQIGNAVAPLVGRAVAAQIVEALRVSVPTPQHRWSLGHPQLLRMTMAEAAAYYEADPEQIPAQRTRRSQTAEQAA